MHHRRYDPVLQFEDALMNPSAPAADSVWPKLDFAEPSRTRPVVPYDWARLVNSMGSPTGVPVPCASIAPIVSASTPAAASAAWQAATWASNDGVAMLRVWPSELAAVPRTTASIRSPSRSASGNRLSSTTAQPSERTNPSAASSKAWQRPVGESMPCADAQAFLRGSCMTMQPPASARSLSPPSRLRQARCTASRPDEHAVSKVSAGPCTPRV